MAWYFNIPAQPTPSVGFLWQPTIAGTNKFDLFDFTECEFNKLNLQATDPLLGAHSCSWEKTATVLLFVAVSSNHAELAFVFDFTWIHLSKKVTSAPLFLLPHPQTCQHSWSVRFACALRDGSTTTEVLPWTLGLLVYVVLAFQLLNKHTPELHVMVLRFLANFSRNAPKLASRLRASPGLGSPIKAHLQHSMKHLLIDCLKTVLLYLITGEMDFYRHPSTSQFRCLPKGGCNIETFVLTCPTI